MKVLVVGSTHFAGAEDNQDRFIAACRDLGKALAQAKCQLVVGSDRPNTADKYVVEGAIEVPGNRKIWVFHPKGGETPFLKERDKHSNRIEFIYHLMKGPWAAGRTPQILAADAVILIGGGRGTSQIGYMAPTLERPVLAVPSFGGAASELWETFEPFYERLGPPVKEKLNNLHIDWEPSNANLVIQVLQELVRRRLFRRESITQPLVILLLALFLIGLWVELFVSPPSSRTIAFFGLLGVSAFIGTGIRSVLSLLFDPTNRLSPSKILAEVCAGLLLAFGLAVIYLIGGFTITGKFEFISSTAQPEDFQRIALSMTVLGLMGGWLIERVSESLQQWLAQRLPSQSGSTD